LAREGIAVPHYHPLKTGNYGLMVSWLMLT
jgi:hypothetical protein